MNFAFFYQLTVPNLGKHHITLNYIPQPKSNALRSNGKILSCVAKSYWLENSKKFSFSFIFHWFLFNFRSQLFSELGHKGCNKRHSGIRSGICPIYINVSSVVEFKTWWVLKSKIFGQESTYPKDFILNPSMNYLQFIKKWQKCTFKVNFWFKNRLKFFKKERFI